MNGIINVNKSAGMTSHDVVQRVRRLLNIKKVGHTGTLDPAATGVLPICIGRATKVADMITDSDKTYRTVMVLGVATDTQDATGEIIKQCVVNVTDEDIKSAVGRFVGKIEQIPPMYSAVRVGGKRLYELAREGKVVERQARTVEIKKIDILDINLAENTVKLEIECSKGTYIRTLCNDIGDVLGCGAHVLTLERTRTGIFKIEESVTLDELECAVNCGEDDKYIIDVDDIFADYKKIIVAGKNERLIKNGGHPKVIGVEDGNTYRVYGEDGRFLGLCIAQDDVLKMLKNFFV